MDPFDALDLSAARFRCVLAAVAPAHLELPTPCAGWNVRDLLNHVIGGQRRYARLLAGAPTAEVEADRDADHLGADPVVAFDAGHAALDGAFRRAGALQRVVHHRAGDRSGADLLLMRVVEYTLHGWDLATATGADDTIDAALAGYLLAQVSAARHLWEGSRPTFAEPAPYDDAGSAQDRLLVLTGRRPRGNSESAALA